MYLIKYQAMNTFIEPSLKQTQCLQVWLTAVDGELLVWTVSYILNTVRDSALSLRKKLKKKHATLLLIV
jgi:hypothetical protein